MLRAIRCICNFTTVALHDLDNSCIYCNARDVFHKNLNYLVKYNFFFFLCEKYRLLCVVPKKKKKEEEDDSSFDSENFNFKTL